MAGICGGFAFLRHSLEMGLEKASESCEATMWRRDLMGKWVVGEQAGAYSESLHRRGRGGPQRGRGSWEERSGCFKKLEDKWNDVGIGGRAET